MQILHPHQQLVLQGRRSGCSKPPTRAVAVRAQADTSRRDVLGSVACSTVSLWLLASQQHLPAYADEAPAAVEEAVAEPATVESSSSATVSSSTTAAGQRQVYLDVNVEGKPLGRIVIALAGDAKVGSQRFADLAEGKEGVGYRLSKFDGIFPTYIRNEGVKSLSYNAAGSSQIAGGDSVQDLEAEFAASSRKHDQAGLVSIVVREAEERPVKERLVAMGGKLVTLKEQAGEAPNGTQFMITTGPTPELDKTNLVVGQVVGGFDVVQALAALPFARPRDSWYDEPFFNTGKMIGDKRAVVAEKRFRRPLKRVLVANAGLVN